MTQRTKLTAQQQWIAAATVQFIDLLQAHLGRQDRDSTRNLQALARLGIRVEFAADQPEAQDASQ